MDIEIKDANLTKLSNLGDDISFADLFNPEFISEYTDFDTIQELFTQSGFKIETEDDFKAVPDADWDSYIIENTKFTSWKAMQIKAFEVFTDKILFS